MKRTKGSLPKSRKEALANPVRVIDCDWKATKENIRKGDLEPFRWILNRPMSLKFDCGIKLSEPTCSGELEVSLD